MTWAALPISLLLTPVLAQTDRGGALRALEFSLPDSPWEWLLYGGVFLLVFVLAVFVYVRDTIDVGPFWRVWLTVLRLGVLAALVVIALNPQERTQKMSYRPSRVVVMADVSLSMGFPETIPPSGTDVDPGGPTRSRAEAVQALLADSPLLKTLERDHEVSVFTFDSEPVRQHVFGSQDPRYLRVLGEQARRLNGKPEVGGELERSRTGEDALDWDEVLRPRGLETRLGESARRLIDESAGPTLAGIVILSDGGENAGIDYQSANAAAKGSSPPVKLITVGVGSTQKQANLQIASVQAPTDVHISDSYDITAFVQGQGLSGRSAEVELLTRPGDDEGGEPTVIETREVALAEDGIPVEVKFPRTPSVAGPVQYTVRVRPSSQIREADESDNQEEFAVNVIDRKTRVLLIAGGPMRDYLFVRNMLYRHAAIEVDAWLQTVDPAKAGQVSQEVDNLLTEFPASPGELFDRYDAIIAFDPDWRQVPEESRKLLQQWVSDYAGGMIVVAGDVYTPQLASAEDELEGIQALYPVYLHSYLLDFSFDSESDQPWPVGFTREGQEAGFLQLAEEQAASREAWKEFQGMFRAYPTAGGKAGTTVYANFSDPRAQNEHGPPVLMASQFYGSGRVFYLGSGEMWRLRAVSDEYYDRYWTKLIREVAQGRLKRGASRAMLLPERDRYYLGQTVRVRARVLDPQFQPVEQDAIALEVYDPSGKPLVPARQLLRDRNRPGEYVGDFRANLPGRYRLELPIPESNDVETREISVRLPNLESDNPEQNASLLTELTRDTGGKYLRLEECEKELPKLLTSRGEEFIVDERLRTLWDRRWVMYLLVGLLSAEWLTRKLLKLA